MPCFLDDNFTALFCMRRAKIIEQATGEIEVTMERLFFLGEVVPNEGAEFSLESGAGMLSPVSPCFVVTNKFVQLPLVTFFDFAECSF